MCRQTVLGVSAPSLYGIEFVQMVFLLTDNMAGTTCECSFSAVLVLLFAPCQQMCSATLVMVSAPLIGVCTVVVLYCALLPIENTSVLNSVAQFHCVPILLAAGPARVIYQLLVTLPSTVAEISQQR